ncbi:MAG: hypothetical protein DMF73_06865 [Acidobacteria bacterium]|nr:MAG: hypothetical protein DMF73_06865 [Acidobacteriota bacterium]
MQVVLLRAVLSALLACARFFQRKNADRTCSGFCSSCVVGVQTTVLGSLETENSKLYSRPCRVRFGEATGVFTAIVCGAVGSLQLESFRILIVTVFGSVQLRVFEVARL